jgi:hypothetical protein
VPPPGGCIDGLQFLWTYGNGESGIPGCIMAPQIDELTDLGAVAGWEQDRFAMAASSHQLVQSGRMRCVQARRSYIRMLPCNSGQSQGSADHPQAARSSLDPAASVDTW